MKYNEFFVPKTLAIIGAGPSGCVLAAFLAKSGCEVVLCDVIGKLTEPVMKRGIKIDGCEEVRQSVACVCNNIEEIADQNPDIIFVATKAMALPAVSESLRKIHRNGVYVVSWQNGIDTEKELLKNLDSKWVMRAVVNYGCSLVSPAHAHLSFHHPPHYIQEMDSVSIDVTRQLAALMSSCGLITKRTDDIKSMVWRKAILNAAMNPVCAVTGLTMYEAMRNTHVFDIVDSLLKECILIAKANRICIEDNYYGHAINYMRNAGDHKPSMLMDIENGRSTEIDYINGKFKEYGLASNVKTPYNSIFIALTKQKESEFIGG